MCIQYVYCTCTLLLHTHIYLTLLLQLKFGNKVMIMELCTGGSLYEVIDSPPNGYGLSETEFKQVIYDVG